MNRDRDISTRGEAASGDPMTGTQNEYGFHRPAWFEMIGQHCFANNRTLWPRADAGSARATLPLLDEGDRLAALANYYSFSYAPLFEEARSKQTREQLIATIADQLRHSHDRISLYPLIDNGDDMPELIRKAFANVGWIALLTKHGTNYISHIQNRDFASYWNTRPSALRSVVKRKGKLAPYEYRILEQIDNRIWDQYLEVYSASWKNAEPYPEMVRAIADDAQRRGVLRICFAYENAQPVAVQLWTIEGDTACIHKIAHIRSEDQHSPGTLLSHHVFAHMIDVEKVACIDYGTGGNAYKQDWMEVRRPMFRLDCLNPRKPQLWLPALRIRISRLVHRTS